MGLGKTKKSAKKEAIEKLIKDLIFDGNITIGLKEK